VKKFILRLATSAPAGLLLYGLIRLYTLTFHSRVENERSWQERVENGGAVLLCTWHQQFFSAIRHFRKYRRYHPSLMISRSRDGDIIARVAGLTGWHAVRGSSSRDGSQALATMVEALSENRLAVHIVDGPNGPAGRVKAGAIALAHAADAVIVPFYVTADRAWYFNSWDRFFIPKPFARVVLRFGETITLEATENSDAFEEQRLALERTMRSEAGMSDR
jgi:hypothetical protein